MAEEVSFLLKLQDQFSKPMQEAKGHADALEHSMEGLKETVIELAGIYAGAEFLKGSFEEYTEHTEAVAKLTAMYNNNKESVKENLDQLKELSEHLEKTTGIDAEATLAAESSLMKYKDLQATYEEIIPIAGDFAKATGTDIADAANTMGRAMENPERAMRLLMQAGASPEQLKVIQNLNEQGKAAQAQAEILDILKEKYSGVAQAMFEANPAEQLKVQMKEVKEGIGELLTEALQAIMPLIKGFIEGIMTIVKWIKEHTAAIKVLVTMITAAIVTYKTIGLAVAAYNTYTEIAATLSGIKMVAALGEQTTAQLALNAAMEANPIGVIIAGVMALAGAVMYLKNQVDALFDSYKSAAATFKQEALDKETQSVINLRDHYIKLGMSKEQAEDKALESANKLVDARIAALKVQYESAQLALKQVEIEKQAAGLLGNFISDKKEIEEALAAKGALEAAMGQKKALGNKSIFERAAKGAVGDKIDNVLNQSEKVTGTKQLTINVSINKLVESLKIESQNIKDGATMGAEHVTRALIASVNQFQASIDT